MAKQRWLQIINPLLPLLIINQLASGLNGRRLGHELFEKIHVGGAFVLAGLALVHLILNWNWVKANYFKRPPPRQ